MTFKAATYVPSSYPSLPAPTHIPSSPPPPTTFDATTRVLSARPPPPAPTPVASPPTIAKAIPQSRPPANPVKVPKPKQPKKPPGRRPKKGGRKGKKSDNGEGEDGGEDVNKDDGEGRGKDANAQDEGEGTLVMANAVPRAVRQMVQKKNTAVVQAARDLEMKKRAEMSVTANPDGEHPTVTFGGRSRRIIKPSVAADGQAFAKQKKGFKRKATEKVTEEAEKENVRQGKKR